jgi:hypothetical protein
MFWGKFLKVNQQTSNSVTRVLKAVVWMNHAYFVVNYRRLIGELFYAEGRFRLEASLPFHLLFVLLPHCLRQSL